MKILKFNRDIFDSLPALQEVVGGGIPVSVIADSALNRNRLPVFIPDFAREGWQLELWLGTKISRLGKFIAPQFADRYIDGQMVCALLQPTDGSATALCFDGALTAGELFPLNKEGDIEIRCQMAPLRKVESETITKELIIGADQLYIEELIARASIYSTLKSGDIILLGRLGIELPLILNHSVKVKVGEEDALSTRLK